MGIYTRVHRFFSRKEERGQYSAGGWQALARGEVLSLCAAGEGDLLEIGCGEGLFLARLAQASPCARIWGTDIDDRRLELARARIAGLGLKNVRFSAGDGVPPGVFAPESFDTVVCVNVVLNLPDTARVSRIFAESWRVCKKGGRFVFDFRNGANPLLVLKYRLARFYDPTVRDLPLRAYAPEKIRALLEDAGFSLRKVVRCGFPFKPLAPVIVVEAVKR